MSIRKINDQFPVLGCCLAIILIASVASSQGIIDYLRNLQDNSGPKYNFNYKDGERPWESHIPTEPTITFEELLRKSSLIRRYLCHGDSTDFGKEPFGRIKPTCMQGHGAKMVVTLGYPTWSYEICISPELGGLFQQAHYSKGLPRHFFNDSLKSQRMYFLLPFEDYEIPVYSIEEPEAFLPIWKHMLMAKNGMDDDYFRTHIRVMAAYIDDIFPYSYRSNYFKVEYYFYVNWARVKLEDYFLVKDTCCNLADMIDTLEYEKSYQSFIEKLDWEQWRKDRLKQIGATEISRIQRIDSVISKDMVVEIVSGVSPLLRFDVNHNIGLSPQGELIMSLLGVIDWDANKCQVS